MSTSHSSTPRNAAAGQTLLLKLTGHGQHLSNRHCHTAGMINKYSRYFALKPNPRPRVVASFGRASLVNVSGPNCELRGASEEEFTAAKEWISLFLHEACLDRCFRGGQPAIRAAG